MSQGAVSFFCGVLFAIGLGVAGMTQPQKVLAFLDVFGDWDPSLIFVMAGAILVYAPAYALIKKRTQTPFQTPMHLPAKRPVDAHVIQGAFLFGCGWGLAGYCPGPAIASIGSLSSNAVLFVVTMKIGMLIHKRKFGS